MRTESQMRAMLDSMCEIRVSLPDWEPLRPDDYLIVDRRGIPRATLAEVYAEILPDGAREETQLR